MLAYADVCSKCGDYIRAAAKNDADRLCKVYPHIYMELAIEVRAEGGTGNSDADVCRRMLTYADVC
jgi:hypothetical protein